MGYIKFSQKKFDLKHKVGSLSTLFLLFIFIVMGFSLFRNIIKIKNAKQQIKSAKNQLTELNDNQDKLKEDLDLIQSQQYLDKEAHDKLNLVHEGEVVLVLPEDDVLRRLSPRTQKQEEEMRPLTNWEAWLELFI